MFGPHLPIQFMILYGATAIAAHVLAGCAAQLPDVASPAQASISRPAAGPAGKTRATGEVNGYALTMGERKLDCRKLTGRMLIRIAHLRDARTRSGASDLSRGMQSAVTPLLGGTQYGSDPAKEARQDMARLEAYNRRLKELGCSPIDIKARLAEPG